MIYTLSYVVTYQMTPNSGQEERIFNTKQAALDYVTTIKLLGGLAVWQEVRKAQGELL